MLKTKFLRLAWSESKNHDLIKNSGAFSPKAFRKAAFSVFS
jgi:hypothetical protein